MSDENPYAGQGAVMLDIGGDVGALVVEMPVTLVGVEIEIRPVGSGTADNHGDHPHHPHVAVVARRAGEVLVPSLVFPELTEGVYELYERPAGQVRLVAAVQGGGVSHSSWPR